MDIFDVFKSKKSVPVEKVQDVSAFDSDDVHAKYAKAIEPVLLRELGNTPRMHQIRERLMIAIKSM